VGDIEGIAVGEVEVGELVVGELVVGELVVGELVVGEVVVGDLVLVVGRWLGLAVVGDLEVGRFEGLGVGASVLLPSVGNALGCCVVVGGPIPEAVGELVVAPPPTPPPPPVSAAADDFESEAPTPPPIAATTINTANRTQYVREHWKRRWREEIFAFSSIITGLAKTANGTPASPVYCGLMAIMVCGGGCSRF
jgi:hypothetical protein